MPTEPTGSDALQAGTALQSGTAADRVARWELAGGTWQVLARAAGAVTVALCRCDGGEEVERFASSEPALLQLLGGRASSED
ncbi:hypothetical protein [Naasia aerilata]|uniref:Uncharacterized protein n=1 Tax=Naasia aerilata TaxID=1162966 RepID=A0ABN6XQ57_9MICO|nr:hypothetical protein [Naasia aerilata]BDZ45811.1 hypothetical protein GCM10025866_17200 [Naasia aerilata]